MGHCVGPCSRPGGRLALPVRSGALASSFRARQLAATGRRRLSVCASTFEELRTVASETVASAQSKLPLLEQAKNTAERAKQPAEDAERAWQDSHAKLTSLQQETASAMKQLRQDVVAAAGGEAKATHSLLERLTAERLENYRAQNNLITALDWKVYAPRELPLHSIPGGRCIYQLAAAEHEGTRYAVVALGMANPFLVDNLSSLLLHWGCSEGEHSGWMQPPKGWHTSPGVSTPTGSLAWETVFGAYAPVMQGEQVVEAASYSVVLQIPLEGVLALRGGIKCVLKRTDGGQPEWIKAGHHNSADFFLDFSPVINRFERRRREAQAAALAKARAAGLLKDEEEEEEEEEAAAAAKAAAAGKGAKGSAADEEAESKAKAKAAAERKARKAKKKAEEPPPLPEEEPAYESRLPGWVSRVDHFAQLSDIPRERGMAQRLKCLTALAAAISKAGGSRSDAARAVLDRCRDADGLLQQHDLAELSSRAAQQEKEQLQAIYRSASDESGHLMHELTSAAEAARRTAVKLRGRETEVTHRDLEAVAQQTAEELLKRNTGGIWPFKEERQLVFVQQTVMEVSGIDAAVVVQVYVEGTKAAVLAATVPPPPPTVEEAHSAAAGAEAGGEGSDGDDTGDEKGGKKKAVAKKKKKEEPPATFDYVVVGISVAEEFPDGLLSTPLIMHMGLVSHQHAKWQPPPEKWASLPESNAPSPSGAAMHVPFQRYTMRAEDGAPVFVDPTLFALALRMPLRECLEKGVRGVEFVLKCSDGNWRSWKQNHGQSCNFYAELPVPMP
ncbi:hypothetical protein D9Q98_001235 [Chlorella vulgaris]|uniref:Uncharacterized protein n=1 Tax=Chlorella vulgaris TaxID=3077 RepID=A0A9D4Z1Y4_CHLVU|nr:hypothetical protein D9Q98_001235 [Chlorella vulgaris]